MKRNFYILCLVLLSAACSQKDDGSDIDRSGRTVFTVDTEEIELVPGQRVSDTWKAGDRLSLFGSEQGLNLAYELKRSGEGQREARFYGPLVKGDVMASFPYVEGLVPESGKLPFTIPSVQEFEPLADDAAFFRRYCPFLMADAAADENVLHFRYPAGLLEVQIRFDEVVNVTSMELDADHGISGRLLAAPGCAVTPSSVASSRTSLDFGGEAVPSRSGDSFTSFRFVLPHADYGRGSLTLKVSTTDEEFSVAFPAISVPRVAGSGFAVASVQVGTSLIPVFSIENGYLEY
ncbi:MAG: hypothetical protein IJS62_06085 [Bacteroidales bacterium]|nr:hypothetical protein [Bacteroidales bacterium]